jgi:hypothetical protein
MPKNLVDFLSMMDERLWFRMIVCFLPGLVLLKLFGYSADGSLAGMLTAAVLIIGVAIYLLWGRIRGISPGGEGEDGVEEERVESDALAVRSTPEVSGLEQIAVLTELRSLCGEAERESDRLIAMEIQVNPKMSFSEAAQSALARRRILGR